MAHSKSLWRGLFFILLIIAVCGGLALPIVSLPARAAPQMQVGSDIVISQVYGGGGNAGAPYTNDFVELFNPTDITLPLGGWSIQYTAATGTTWQVTPLTNISIAAGQYYLIQLAPGNTVSNPLPAPDATGTINLSGTAGKVALVNTATALSGSGCPFDASVVDFVGYGTTADCREGGATTASNAPAPSNTTADIRNGNSCRDTDNNVSDFTASAPTPRNTSSPLLPCLVVTDVAAPPTADGVHTTGSVIDITVTFSDIVNVTGVPTIVLETGVTNQSATYISGTGSAALTFRYTVVAGDSSGDLDYVSPRALTLSGGTISGATVGVNLTLPDPGSSGSLGANNDIIIDNGLAPTVTVNQANGQADPASSMPINFSVVFSEPIDPSTFTASAITQDPTATATGVIWSITDSGDDINFTLSATFTGQNNVTIIPTISANQVTDWVGTGNSASTNTDNSVTFIDTVPPTVTVNQQSTQADPASTLPIKFAVAFSEPINASTFTVADIAQTPPGTATGITWTITDSGDHKNFTLQAIAVTGAGTLIPSIAAGTVTDPAGNNNTASTSADNTVTYTNSNPTSTATLAVSGSNVVISEFRTRGPSGANDEFVELYNPTSTWIDISSWKINASNDTGGTDTRATIPAFTILRPGQYYLVANNSSSAGYSDATVPANLSYGTGISDTGGIALIRPNNTVSDQVGMSSGSIYKEGTILSPLAGTSDQSYERKLGGASDSCQDTNNNANDFSNRSPSNPHNYSSPLSLCGVPGPSLITTTTTITADSPDPSLVSGLVTVSVTVSVPSGAAVATGTISITGANTTCNINLTASSAGKGSCSVIFTSIGSKGLAATYLGDNTHAASSDTEAHSVTGTPTAVRTRTPQPTPLPPPPLIGLNEFVPRPGHDWNNDGVINTGDEYIELINHGVIDVNLSGYSLDDEVNIGSTPFSLPSITLKPGERHVFYGSETGLLLGDGGDGVRLLKSNGQLEDAYNYTVVRFPDQSYCRLPDNGGLDDWNQNCFPTPGLQNSLSGSAVNPPTENGQQTLCPISDTLPDDFVIAECLPFGNNIWNPAYWDKFGWFDEKYLPESPGKWPLFAE